MLNKLILWLSLCPNAMLAQSQPVPSGTQGVPEAGISRVTLGFVGGLRVSSDMAGNGPVSPTTASKRYVVGPSVEINLRRRFAIEVQTLYRREGYQLQSSGYVLYSSERAHSLEFPVLLKYRVLPTSSTPFLEAGYALRVVPTASADTTTPLCGLHPLGCSAPAPGEVVVNSAVNWPVSHGVTAGVGEQFSVKRFRIAPSIRYTRWINTSFSADIYQYGYGPWHSAHNQLDVLLNIGWKLPKRRPSGP